MRLPAIEDPKEMAAAVRFQAEEQMPMPLDQAVLEHQVVGGVPAEEGEAPKVDVVVIAARRDMVASLVEPVRRAGLRAGRRRPLGLRDDPGAGRGGRPRRAGRARPTEAVLYCNVADVMNLAVARGRACLFTRVANTGLESIAIRLATESGLSGEHAGQWLSHVALEAPAEAIEGDPEIVATSRRVLEEGADGLVDDLRLSLDYYAAQESAIPVDRIVLCGPGGAIAGLAGRMEAGIGLPIAVATPPALAERRDRGRRKAHPALRPGPGELSMRPVNLLPRRGAPRRPGADADRAHALHPRRGAGRSSSSASRHSS